MKRAIASGLLPASKSFGKRAGILFLLGFLFLRISTDAQPNTAYKYTKRTISFIPSKVDKINGLAFGDWSENSKSESDSLKVNGVTLLVNPLMFLFYVYGYFTIQDIDNFENYTADRARKQKQAYLDGLVLSAPGFVGETTIVKGLSLSAVNFYGGEMHGVSISGIANSSYVATGLMLAGGYNSGNKVRGVQIGLVNRAVSLRGFQIGLWNKNGRRSLSFINWQFREKPVGERSNSGRK